MIPAPPPWAGAGSIVDMAGELARHISAERRGTWTLDESELTLDPTGRVVTAARSPFELEAEGLRALLAHFGDLFPRGFGVLSRVSGSSLALVWAELYAPTPGARVKLLVRTTGSAPAVWGVAPATAPAYGVDAFLSDLAAALPFLKGAAFYSASSAGSGSVLEVILPGDLRILYDEAYKGGGVQVLHRGVDPLPGVKARRRADGKGEAGSTVVDSVVTRIRYVLDGAHAPRVSA